jgi:hypothetical protein
MISNFLKAPLILSDMYCNIFFSVNAKSTPIAYVIRLFLSMNRQCTNRYTNKVPRITGRRAGVGDLQLSVGLLLDNSKYVPLGAPLAYSKIFYGVCRNYAGFLYMIPILRRFKLIKCNRQAALHSALFNYTPLVISGDRQKYTSNIIDPTQVQYCSIHRAPECLSLRWNWVSPPPLPQASVSLPLDPKGERSNTPGDDVGVPNSDDWKESLALCILSVYHYQNFEFETFFITIGSN